MDLFTIQLSQRWEARKRDIAVMDTTVKSGYSIFAPTWKMVMDHKHEQITDDQYTAFYHERMNQSWRDYRSDWLKVLEMTEPFAIGCYCKSGAFCHRHLLKNIFEKLCTAKGINFYYYGELMKE